MNFKPTRQGLRILCRLYSSSKSGVEASAINNSPTISATTTRTKETLPVSGHKLSYNEYGDPSAVIRKERFQIDSVPENHVIIKSQYFKI
jgi:hypothetical protein